MTQFEHFKDNEVNFEAYNSQQLKSLYDDAVLLLGRDGALQKQSEDYQFGQSILSAAMHPNGTLFLGIGLTPEAVGEEKQMQREYQLRTVAENGNLELLRKSEDEWLEASLGDSVTASYINDAKKIIIQLGFDNRKRSS